MIEKENRIIESGLNIKIYDKPTAFDHIWDKRYFWEHLEDDNEIINKCKGKGFENINECFDDVIHYMKMNDLELTQI